MNKAVLISIRAGWVEKIANGSKTIEVRRTQPKLKTPFKCYIYMTKNHNKPIEVIENEFGVVCLEKDFKMVGNVIGEFVCDEIDKMLPDYNPATKQFFYNDDWQHNDWNSTNYCLSVDELNDYGSGKTLYGWHISDLKIYDKPKALNEFNHFCPHVAHCEDCVYSINEELPFDSMLSKGCDKRVTRPPQSWQYVEELRDVVN